VNFSVKLNNLEILKVLVCHIHSQFESACHRLSLVLAAERIPPTWHRRPRPVELENILHR
jgi:hypothetical protein